MKEEVHGATRAVLKMAQRCMERGDIYQAADMYQRIMRKHPRTPEAQEARGKVMEIAQQHEANGRRHTALSLYEKAAAFPDVWEFLNEKKKLAPEIMEIIRKAGKSLGEKMLSAGMTGRKRGGAIKRESPARNRETIEEIPFVDLTETVNIKQNFVRLGRVQRRVADHSGTVATLRKLMLDHSWKG